MRACIQSNDLKETPQVVLPQSSNTELALSAVHTTLDSVLEFLHGDVRYALLDDARPQPGGGVRLQPQLPVENVAAPFPKGARSSKRPKEHVQSAPIPQKGAVPPESPEQLDDIVIKLLHEANAQCDGGVSLGGLCSLEEHSLDSSGHIPPVPPVTEDSPDCSSDHFFITQLSKDVSQHALYPCDLILACRFQDLVYKLALADASREVRARAGGDSCEELRHELRSVDDRCRAAIKHDVFLSKVLQSIRLMHLCQWDYADVVLVLAYAGVYFKDAFSATGRSMSPAEAANIIALHIHLAHSFLLDLTCPLKFWHQRIFRDYCTLKILDTALFRLLTMRPGYSLRISDEEQRQALVGLLGSRHLSTPPGCFSSERIYTKTDRAVSPNRIKCRSYSSDAASQASTASTASTENRLSLHV